MWLKGEYITSFGLDIRAIKYFGRVNSESIAVTFGSDIIFMKNTDAGELDANHRELVDLYYKWHKGRHYRKAS